MLEPSLTSYVDVHKVAMWLKSCMPRLMELAQDDLSRNYWERKQQGLKGKLGVWTECQQTTGAYSTMTMCMRRSWAKGSS